MRISKEKVEKAITLKQWYAKKLSEFSAGEDELVGHDYHREAEARAKKLAEFEASKEFHLFKEFLEGLSDDELQELQAIGFYGRGEHKKFASALGEAAEMEQDARDIQYTMQFLSAGDYLEEGFEKLNRRHEI
jgi:hypothetical protein